MSPSAHPRHVDDVRVGTAFRAVRVRRGWRQSDVATKARVSASLVSQIERGHCGTLSLDALRALAGVLEIRIDIVPRWRAGELDRLLNARHASLGEAVTRWLASLGWVVAPEVSFAVYGERGVIDLLAWHGPTRTLLVVELKTEIVDLQDLIGVVDRKRRLAMRVAADRGWHAAVVASCVIVGEGPTNRRRLAAHRALLRSAFPADGRQLRKWLRAPTGSVHALAFFSISRDHGVKLPFSTQKRVRVLPSRSDRGSKPTATPLE